MPVDVADRGCDSDLPDAALGERQPGRLEQLRPGSGAPSLGHDARVLRFAMRQGGNAAVTVTKA